MLYKVCKLQKMYDSFCKPHAYFCSIFREIKSHKPNNCYTKCDTKLFHYQTCEARVTFASPNIFSALN